MPNKQFLIVSVLLKLSSQLRNNKISITKIKFEELLCTQIIIIEFVAFKSNLKMFIIHSRKSHS